ncbi:MAG TPA: acyltransferase [Puia sp.]|jgi:peptidoglycan/LPS O-acetylase OafA/YrhL|nr:acyltransferase [Puia sp.]
MNNMQENRLTFHTFNALRFFAFFRIFLLHLPVSEDNQFYKLISDGGGIGVDFFFVLSGFLITYLLTFEKNVSGTINGFNYFSRRSLRIWPLFFTGIAIAYLNNFITATFHIGSSEGYSPNIFFSITFLENYQMIIHNNFPNGAPLRVFWSLCVEEHFYLLWFIVFKFVSLKNMPKMFSILWIAGIAYRIWFYIQFPQKNYYDIDVISKLDYFCAGSFISWLIAYKPALIKKVVGSINATLRNSFTFLALVFFYFYQFWELRRIDDLYFPIISASVFAILVALVATSSTFIYFSEKNIFSRLGKISYGLYVFHTVVILSLITLAKFIGISFTNGISYFLFAVLSLAFTIAISKLSYHYLESPFLRLKKKFRSVPAG